jgi:SAM-dependent methyltransferase
MSRIIDIGSGCGRLAIPFSLLIKEGAYFGTDVFEDGIEWCAKNITTQNPKFKFFLQDVENNYYFGGEIKPSTRMSLEFAESNSIDFVFAISVFTHLVEDDAQKYFNEIARCLNRDGVAYLTAFIIDDTFRAFVQRTGLHTAVKRVSEGHYQAYEGQDFFAGYEFGRWRTLIERAGLQISGFDPGTWAEKRGALHYQDTFIVTKRS